MKPVLAVAALAIAVAGGLALAPSANADSFSFSYSSGGWHSRPWYGGARYHGPPPRYYGHSYYSAPYWGPPAYRPRVVVVQPPPVAYYTPPPPVMYAPSPYGGQMSAVPASPIYQASNGQYCREYQAGVTVNGTVQPSYGTACLMPDGAWRVVN